jgi:hypothetical protein
MADAVFLLCALTSVACAALLIRAYVRSRTRLLLWSSLCFVGLAVNNLILFTDKVLFPDVQLVHPALRALPALLGVMSLIYGLVWDTD